jgi:hypothetical protein
VHKSERREDMMEKANRRVRARSSDPDVAAPCGSTSQPPHFSIKEARQKISKLVEQLAADSSGACTLGKRDAPTALLVSFARFEPLLSADLNRRLAFLIADQLLGDAPLHLRRSEIEELAVLPKHDLVLLLDMDRLPMAKARQAELERKLTRPEALRRLLRRCEIARTIKQAREDGLYDAAEHLTSSTADAGDERPAAVAGAGSTK